jgi:hypothetical protein
MVVVKNPTAWTPPSGAGYVQNVGAENIVTNLGAFLTDNLGNFLVTTPVTVVPKFPATWTLTSKNDTSWLGRTVTTSTASYIVDSTGVFLVDASGNNVVDTGESLSGKSVTTWTASGA